MARKPQVTRTIKVQSVRCLIVDIESKATSERTFEVPARFRREAQIREAISGLIAETEKVVTIYDTAVKYKLYAMEEADFIKVATFVKEVDKTEKE